MGCLRRLGCLILVAIVVGIGWFTRDLWLPHRFRRQAAVAASSRPATWEPLSDAGAERARTAITRLGQRQGPVFQTLSGADAASYVIHELAAQLPASADSIQAMVAADHVTMRGTIKLADVGSTASLGPLAAMLGDRAPVQLTGTLRVVEPGLAEFKIEDVKIHDLSVPRPMIPALVKRIARGSRPGGWGANSPLDDDALPLPIPRYIAEIRVANGKITLYKNVD